VSADVWKIGQVHEVTGEISILPMTYGGISLPNRYYPSKQPPPPRTGTTEEDEAMTKKNIRKNLLKRARGQGMTEYIIIVALIAIAAIGVITLFGDNIRKLFGMSADSLAGEVSVANRAQKSTGDAIEKKGLKNFGENNAY